MNRILYHLLFWVFIFFFILDYFIYEEDYSKALSLTTTECILYMTISYCNLYILIKYFLFKKESWKYLISLIVFLVILFFPYYYFELGTVSLNNQVYKTIISFTLNYILFIIISFLYWYVLLFQKEKHKTLELENQKLQAEIQLVKSQVSPHFLFNSLNNIYSLSLNKKNDEALKMIEILSGILRYFIYTNTSKFASLKSEIEIINQFITFHNLKNLKGKVNLTINNKTDYDNYKIIPLVLITIIENGFKHSNVSYNENGFLNISLDVNNILTLITENSFDKKEDTKGIGMKMIQKQLEYYYPKNHSLEILINKNNYKLTLTIKL